MFSIFINDLQCYVKLKFRLFADDTVIYLTIKSERDCQQLQDDLLEAWKNGNPTGVWNLIQASATLYE